MSGKKVLLLAIVMSVGLSLGFANQKAMASEAEAGITAVTDEMESGTDEIASETDSSDSYVEVATDTEDLTDTDEEVIRVLDTDEDTVLYSGTDGILYQTEDGALYYVSASTGKSVISQLVEISSGSYKGTYYFGSDGYAVKNAFQIVSSSTYYFGTDGVKYTGTGKKTIDGYVYYFKSGVVQTGWQTIDGSTYYFRKTASSTMNKGAMLTGLKKNRGL